MSTDDTQTSTTISKRRWVVIVAIAIIGLVISAVVALASGLFTAGEPGALGSDDAINAGERRAAEFSGGDPEISAQQSVAGEELFSYRFAEGDVAAGETGSPFIGNQLLVSPTEDGGVAAVKDAAAELDAVIVGVNDYVSSYQLLLPEVLSEEDLAALVDKVADDSDLESVTTNVLIPMSPAGVRADGDADITPEQAFTDAATSSGWQRGSWGMQAIGAPVLWDYAEQADLKTTIVGEFDSFRDGRFHDDLAGTEFPVPLDPGTAKTEPNSHGLHVAGIIGADGAIRGAAPNAHLLLGGWSAESPGWLWDKFGVPWKFTTDLNSLTGEVTALAASGASIVNVSQGAAAANAVAAQNGSTSASADIADVGASLGSALSDIVEAYPGLLVVAAAGNWACSPPMLEAQTCKVPDESAQYTDAPLRTSSEWGLFAQARMQFPELEDHVLLVGSAAPLFGSENRTEGLEMWGRSQWGADILAPGVSILSTVDPEDCNAETSAWCDDGYGYMSGTSMSAPHVAGVAAVLRGANPDLTAAQVKRILLGTAGGTPLLQVDEGAAGLAAQESPLINAAAALRLAIQTEGSSGKDVDGILNKAIDAPTVISQLQGAWCPADQTSEDAADCLDLESLLEAHPDTEMTQPTALDPTGRASLASEFMLCVDGPCASAIEPVSVRYYPPGAVWECSTHGSQVGCPDDAEDQLAGHAVGWPRVVLTHHYQDALTRTEVLRLNLFADGEFAELPDVTASPVSSTWCPTADSPEDTCFTVTGTSNADSTITFDGGESMVLTRMSDGADCIAYSGNVLVAGELVPQMPLGSFCGPGDDAQINDFYGIQDHPDEDRVWNGQTGVLYLRAH